MTLLGNGELAVTKGVPELDGAITGTRDNLSVVGGERDREDIVGVTNEAAGGGSGGELPEAESLIPGGGKSVSTVGGDNAVGDDVGVAVEGALWVSVGRLITGQVPDDEGLVTGTGQEHVWAAKAIVSLDLETEVVEFGAYFSMLVAREVTHPLWPSRVPFKIFS